VSEELHGNTRYDKELINKVGLLYRAGQLSIKEISRQTEVSRATIYRWAEEFGWTRDLQGAVREETKRRLAEMPEILNAENEEQAVDAAARIAVEVVRQHQQLLNRSKGLSAILLEELQKDTSQYSEHLETIDEITRDDPNALRRLSLERAVSLRSRAQVLRDLSAANKMLLELDRKAHGLDDDEKEASVYEVTLQQLIEDQP